MIEEPYRWLEAIANRREYVREQIKGGTPVFAASLSAGILLLGVGTGNSKVFELFDRHALVGLGHPADIEKIRQAAIDAAHMEAFTRAPEDVSLRRLVSYGLSPQLKTSFEQVFSAPFLVEFLLAELGPAPENDLLLRLHFDGGFQFEGKPVIVAASEPEWESSCQAWLNSILDRGQDRTRTAEVLLQAWWAITEKREFDDSLPEEEERRSGWRQATRGKVVEIGWLSRQGTRAARFEMLTLAQLGL